MINLKIHGKRFVALLSTAYGNCHSALPAHSKNQREFLISVCGQKGYILLWKVKNQQGLGAAYGLI